MSGVGKNKIETNVFLPCLVKSFGKILLTGLMPIEIFVPDF
jgi:hypothetical protein